MELNYRESEGPAHPQVDDIGEAPGTEAPGPRGDEFRGMVDMEKMFQDTLQKLRGAENPFD